ncbi:hypothetical protein [Aquimarina mytili]|uniref:Lipocalin-like domain-containing protein n=1 Tax=Aquimarina mytili TaxID=874423 RepID=A0A936ZSF5_9FLAO|nr:hypothetical protein [Aquimarina mytili]MBL0684572.1 hypothetical protein [Aquimarina mytili]
MEKFLLVYTTRVVILCLLLCLYSCENNTSNPLEANVVGKWQLEKEFSSEGSDVPLKEFPLSACDKETVLEIMENGIFIEKSYYEDLGTGGECIMDNQDTIGKWKKGRGNFFLFTYDKKDNLSFKKSRITIENENLVVALLHNDPDLDSETFLKFIYSKVY